jgi:hypothetical protein
VGSHVSTYDLAAAVRACRIELAVHATLLLGVLTPLYAVLAPIQFFRSVVFAAYTIALRICASRGIHLEPIPQLNYEGHAMLLAAISLQTASIVAIVVLAFRRLGSATPIDGGAGISQNRSRIVHRAAAVVQRNVDARARR